MNAHQLTLIGLGLALAGAAAFALGALSIVRGNRDYSGPSDAAHRREKVAYLIGSSLLFAGFALQLWAAVIRR